MCESTLNKNTFYLCPLSYRGLKQTNKQTPKHKQTHKQNQGKPYSDYKKTQCLRDRELFLCGKMGTNSQPRLFSPSFFLTLLPPFPLPSPFTSWGLPSLCCCSPLILCCLFHFSQFPSNSCLQLTGRAVDILQAEGLAGLGLSSWVMADPRSRGHAAATGQQFLHQSLVTT